MKKAIRKTLPRNISIGILIIVAVLVYFLAGQLFETKHGVLDEPISIYTAYLLVSISVIVMVLILWEEILFPVDIKEMEDGYIFRNHRSKLRFQALLYLIIPAIVVFLFLNFEISVFRFGGWAAIVLVFPVIGKLMTGINNYNDFLKLTPTKIEFKDNDHEGVYQIAGLEKLALKKDESGNLSELILNKKGGEQEIVQVHQMELNDFFDFIENYVNETYQSLL